MNKSVIQFILIGIGLFLVTGVGSHPATERYIPIGYWASVSGPATYTGKIETHNSKTHSMRIKSSSGMKNVVITPTTRIWLDRSSLKLTNLKGGYADCQPGRTVEVRLRENGTEADWVKVQITTP